MIRHEMNEGDHLAWIHEPRDPRPPMSNSDMVLYSYKGPEEMEVGDYRYEVTLGM